jgi:hypothetical protein
MTRSRVASLALVGLAAAASLAVAQGIVNVRAAMGGYDEVPAVSTTGTGAFSARIDETNQQITWELSYDALEGAITQSHIHVGQAGVNGGISAFLCSNLGNGPAGTQPCPAAPATISGIIVPGDVVGPAGQGVAAGEFAELVAAIRAGAAYANVHSTKFPGGEARGTIAPGHSGH